MSHNILHRKIAFNLIYIYDKMAAKRQGLTIMTDY